MSVSKEDILESIANMSVMDVVELVEAMEEKFGVSAAAPVAVAAAAPADGGAAAEEKTEFDVVLTGFGDKKLNVVKTVKALTGASLMEAKKLVEAAPATLKEAVPKEEAEKMKADLEEAGASVELK